MTLEKSGERLTKEQIEALVHHWSEMEIDYLDDCLAMGRPVNDEQREGEHLVYSDLFDELLRCLERRMNNIGGERIELWDRQVV